jgi:hypothetical protein
MAIRYGGRRRSRQDGLPMNMKSLRSSSMLIVTSCGAIMSVGSSIVQETLISPRPIVVSRQDNEQRAQQRRCEFSELVSRGLIVERTTINLLSRSNQQTLLPGLQPPPRLEARRAADRAMVSLKSPHRSSMSRNSGGRYARKTIERVSR